jgi:hypothetical protein
VRRFDALPGAFVVLGLIAQYYYYPRIEQPLAIKAKKRPQ